MILSDNKLLSFATCNNNFSPENFIRYIIISPAKDEAQHIELTLKSVTEQTLKPILWVIVDDASKDNTSDIISRYFNSYPFIRLVKHSHDSIRKTGSAVIRAFNYGYAAVGNIDYDFIVKLDCDLSFDADYFEKLLKQFLMDQSIGIASGVYLESDKHGLFTIVSMPSYHAAGACKVIRRRCFEEIGGFIESAGWDTVDEIRAMTRGWKTCHFRDLRMLHHRAEGTGIGVLRTSAMHGKIYYLTGGGCSFFLLKTIHRLLVKPYLLNSIALLCGYLISLFRKEPLLVNDKEARFYRYMLNKRLFGNLRELVKHLHFSPFR
jgi:glycosyltransferase involved in cell wall biosynthesis